jgi:hypothetical protein
MNTIRNFNTFGVTELTLNKLKEFDSESNAINYAESFYGEYPNKPKKPLAPKIHTSESIKNYSSELETYETNLKEYEITRRACNIREIKINNIIIDYIKYASNIETIPEQYRDKVYSKAYEKGHSSGFYEIYCDLCGLVEIFN